MTDFSLTSPQPLSSAGKRDPNVFAPRPGRDYADVATLAWLEAQHGALDLDDLDAAITATRERVRNGERWLDEHDRSHPDYRRAELLKADLDNRVAALLIQYRVAAYACWVHCMELYAALQHIDRRAWIAEYTPRRFTGDTPQGIWHALRGTQPPPGAWPPDQSEQWVERRIAATEVWNLEWLHERLEDRKAGDA